MLADGDPVEEPGRVVAVGQRVAVTVEPSAQVVNTPAAVTSRYSRTISTGAADAVAIAPPAPTVMARMAVPDGADQRNSG